jgi:hypothetical protein
MPSPPVPTGSPRRRVKLVGLAAVILAVVAGGWWVTRTLHHTAPRCTAVTLADVALTVEQADNAATVAAVGLASGMPDHAITVALATALQESGLRNLSGGDRDSAGLFQQRPSQGWGTYPEVIDPVHASRAFYARLRQVPTWETLDVAEAAQAVQRSADPAAYAQWEPLARAVAAALTGEQPAALTCQGITSQVPGDDVATLAQHELGTSRLTGPQPPAHGWAIASWLVAHASRLGVSRVHYDGRLWTVDSGAWANDGPPSEQLSWERA